MAGQKVNVQYPKIIFIKLIKILSRMKQFLVLFALVGMFALNANAQTCNKSKASCSAAKTTAVQSTNAAADKAAMLDGSIEKKVCSQSGTVSYIKNATCAVSGKTTATPVEFCSKSGKFVNVSPSDKADCSKTCTKGKATQTSVKATKVADKGAACCASKNADAKAACTKTSADGTVKATAAPTDAKATMISNKGN